METEKGMFYSDRCKFCHDFGEKIEPYLCEDCKQKIFDWINSKGWILIPCVSGRGIV